MNDRVQPFLPQSPTQHRKHGPSGYVNYTSYKDWLRDEFKFRCVYCLERETWYPSRQAAFAVDHILPQVSRPDLVCDYDNLTYACLRCNSLKQAVETLDPSKVRLEEHVSFNADGSVVARTAEGSEFILLFHLDEQPASDVRKEKLSILELKNLYPDDPVVQRLFREAFGYPADLPDLRPPAKRPKDNSRPDGVSTCHFVLRLEGKLPEVY